MADTKFNNAISAALANLATARIEIHKHVNDRNFDDSKRIEELAWLANDLLDRKIYAIEIEPAARYKEPVCEVPTPFVEIIDEVDGVSGMVDACVEEVLAKADVHDGPDLYMDCEGQNLGREGTLTHINIYLPRRNKAFILDIDQLGGTAFDIKGTTHETTLTKVLQDWSIKKAIFDCRSDSDVLFAHHKIALDGVIDLQLLEIATSRTRKNAQKLNSLSSCIGRLNMQKSARDHVLEIKERGKEAMKQGNPFHERPLSKLMIEYSIGDLLLMPALYQYFTSRPGWNEEWAAREQHATTERLEVSRAPDFREREKAGLISMKDAPEEWKSIDRFEDIEKAARSSKGA
ncbi:Putative 3'-5' exonuclease domain, ribonuclease H-like superfamily [Septoria linicola]|uniref:3'-5' exonuclease domain, ribonuclease H-like superfamily n=1 Tax=Septoria linicola TaxID=215465 RepID=A0A9Q9AJI9_9PEZI|nr:Putative 3'-5' exonuclease domain, ribonuclease H-like superfamily [Septoria linicola]